MRNLTFEESILQNYVIWTPKTGIVYDRYWNYCKDNKIPFVAITQNRKHTRIVLDMFPASWDLSPETLTRIADLLDEAPQKNRKVLSINSERIQATIKTDLVKGLARIIYSLALSDRENIIKPSRS